MWGLFVVNQTMAAVEIVRTLLSYGACPNVIRGDGQHLLAICRGRAKWIDNSEPSMANTFFRLKHMFGGGLDDVERKEREKLVELVTNSIRQHKLCRYCKARKQLKHIDQHLGGGNDTDELLASTARASAIIEFFVAATSYSTQR